MQISTIVLVEDNQIFRKGLNLLLNDFTNVKVVGEATSGQEFIDMLDTGLVPDIVFMDIKMPEMDGIEATVKALEKNPDLKIIALTMFAEKEYIFKMIDAGASGFIPKNIPREELHKCIDEVSSGGSYFSKELLEGASDVLDYSQKCKEESVNLTARETEVLELICKGLSTSEVAEKLFISQRTVEIHRASLLNKTKSKNAVSLVVYAIKNKLVEI